MLTAVTGIKWGDEGKGRVIDLLAERADIVVRYQGGNNAGHTVVTKQGKFILNLLPSGILHPNVVCVLADGMVVDLEHLSNEIADIRGKGVSVTPQNFKLSARATISMPWHRIQDDLEEERLAQSGVAFGSTRRGIAYAYSDKYRKKTLRLGDLLHLDEPYIQVRLKTMLEAKNLELAGCYHQEPMSYPALLAWCQKQAKEFLPYICDTGNYLDTALSSGKQMVLEAQLGAMRDIDYGIFPYRYNERESAKAHVDFLPRFPNSIILFDRGYPSEDMFHYLNSKGILFLMRVPKTFKKAISEQEDALFTYPASCNKESLTLRSIHFLLEDGSTEYLVTNLMPEQIAKENFPDLYQFRWGVESKYRELKNRLEIEAFNSIKPASIQQEFFAAMYLSNLVAVIKSESDSKIIVSINNRHAYQANRSYILNRIKNCIVHLLRSPLSICYEMICRIVEEASKTCPIIRPDRKFGRYRKHTRRRYYSHMKSCI